MLLFKLFYWQLVCVQVCCVAWRCSPEPKQPWRLSADWQLSLADITEQSNCISPRLSGALSEIQWAMACCAAVLAHDGMLCSSAAWDAMACSTAVRHRFVCSLRGSAGPERSEEERSVVAGACGVSAAGSARVEECRLRALQQRSRLQNLADFQM